MPSFVPDILSPLLQLFQDDYKLVRLGVGITRKWALTFLDPYIFSVGYAFYLIPVQRQCPLRGERKRKKCLRINFFFWEKSENISLRTAPQKSQNNLSPCVKYHTKAFCGGINPTPKEASSHSSFSFDLFFLLSLPHLSGIQTWSGGCHHNDKSLRTFLCPSLP